MKAFFNDLLTVSSLDPQDARRRKLTTILVLGMGVLAALGIVLTIAFDPTLQLADSQLSLLISVIMLAGMGVLYAINRWWSGKVAAVLLILLLIVGLAFSDSPQEVSNGRSLGLFALPIIMASVLLPPVSTFVATAAVSAIISYLAISVGIDPNISAILGFAAISLVAWLAMRGLEQALADLHKINTDLDNLVAERTRELYEALLQVSAESGKNEAILQSIADGVIVFDGGNKAFTANASATALLNRTSSEIVGNSLEKIIEGDLDANDRDLLMAQFTGKESTDTHLKLNWGKKVLSTSLATVENPQQGLIGTVVVFRDFTKEAELERMKSAFVSMASHELRTPLNAILGYTDMLREKVYGELNEEQVLTAERVIANVHRMLALVNNLLDQAQIEAGGLKPNFVDFDIKHLVSDIQMTMKVLAQQRGTTLNIDVASGVPEQLVSDPQRLQQILINLLGNAIKFTEKGRIDIKVSQPDPHHWAMAVVDTGPGIPADAVGYVFQPFRQVEDPIRRKHGGTGLGLAIVKELTELLGGSISLESTVGVGSTFTAVFPVEPIKEPVL